LLRKLTRFGARMVLLAPGSFSWSTALDGHFAVVHALFVACLVAESLLERFGFAGWVALGGRTQWLRLGMAVKRLKYEEDAAHRTQDDASKGHRTAPSPRRAICAVDSSQFLQRLAL